MSDDDTFTEVALQSFVDGARVLTHELTKKQAEALLVAAKHLTQYLTTEYKLDDPLEEGREHLTTGGEFRSDKYPWCVDGFVPLKLTDASAWPMLRAYADVRASVDQAFADDLHEALDLQGAPR